MHEKECGPGFCTVACTHAPPVPPTDLTESTDSVMETGADMGGTSTAEAANWWADCFPQWRNDHA